MISKLLKQNPEYYTMWNHRRLVMRELFRSNEMSNSNPDENTKMPQSSENTIEFISNDLNFLVPLLRKFPKCYWIWNYRLWLLEETSRLFCVETSRKFWQQELTLVGKMLSLDGRNFHGWGYRRMIIMALEREELTTEESSKSMVEEEFAYTTKMIEINLSNFSAWHNRSKLASRLLNERGADLVSRQKFLDDGQYLEKGVR